VAWSCEHGNRPSGPIEKGRPAERRQLHCHSGIFEVNSSEHIVSVNGYTRSISYSCFLFHPISSPINLITVNVRKTHAFD
jgi:hypothetical protein